MFYVIVYDLPATKEGNRRRSKLAKILEGYGDRAQYSVFEVDVTAEDYAKMVRDIEKTVNAAEDQVRIYPMHEDMKNSIVILGAGEPFHIEDAYFF